MRTFLQTPGADSRAVEAEAMGNDGTLEDHAVRECHSLGASAHMNRHELQVALPDPCFLVCCWCVRQWKEGHRTTERLREHRSPG